MDNKQMTELLHSALLKVGSIYSKYPEEDKLRSAMQDLSIVEKELEIESNSITCPYCGEKILRSKKNYCGFIEDVPEPFPYNCAPAWVCRKCGSAVKMDPSNSRKTDRDTCYEMIVKKEIKL